MRALVLSAVFALAFGTAVADGCHPSTTDAIAAGDHYVYVACLDMSWQGQQECSWWGFSSTWVYEESNGIPGLQRGDEMRDDTCHGQIPSDTVIF